MAYDWTSGSRLKLRHLQLMVAIGRYGSLGLAARHLNISQPAASRLLAEVEGLVGEIIFERLPRGLSPNAYGSVIIRHARNVLAELSVAGSELDALRSGLSGSVAIGAVNTSALDTVATVIARLLQTNPNVEVQVEIAPSKVLVERLLDGSLDFAFARPPTGLDSELVDYVQVDAEDVSFLVRSDFASPAGHRPSLAEIADLCWAMEPPGTLLRKTVDASFRRFSLKPPSRVLNTTSVLLTLAAVARSGGVGVVPHSVTKLLDTERCYKLIFPAELDASLSVEPFGLMKCSDRQLSPVASFVYERMMECAFVA